MSAFYFKKFLFISVVTQDCRDYSVHRWGRDTIALHPQPLPHCPAPHGELPLTALSRDPVKDYN